jgi:restriction endonuclease
MKKVIWIIIGVAAVGGVGYFVYSKNKRPKVTVDKIDWLTGNASVNVDGKKVEFTKTTAVQLSNGYSVGYASAYVASVDGQDIASVVLKKGDSIVETIASR